MAHLSKENVSKLWILMKSYINARLEAMDGIVEDAIANAGHMEMELLWENASPTSAFAAQTISLDLSGYDMVEIVYRGQIAGSLSLNFYGYKTATCLKNEYSALDSVAFIGASNTGGYAFTRNVQVLETGIVFDVGYSGYTDGSGGASSQNVAIPYRIYGIKGLRGVA